MYVPTVDDFVHDRAQPIVLGKVTRVLKTRVHVWFASGVCTPFNRSYLMRDAQKFLVKE